ncbi:unnamed protein product [Orchesella dallaii]|uniref:Uncharacterized protein n=1 Tax=Orchesella dallaii TaxID=48710 RepID=A0ABP1RRW1_9HEXA
MDSPFSRIAAPPGSANRGSFANRSINKLENVSTEDLKIAKLGRTRKVHRLEKVSSREESEGLGFGQQVDWLQNHKYNKSANGNR